MIIFKEHGLCYNFKKPVECFLKAITLLMALLDHVITCFKGFRGGLENPFILRHSTSGVSAKYPGVNDIYPLLNCKSIVCQHCMFSLDDRHISSVPVKDTLATLC